MADGLEHAALEAATLVPPVVCGALAVVVVAHTARTAPHPRPWLASAAVALLLVAFAVPALDGLFFLAFPLLLAVFPDGRFVPRWTVVPVALSAVATVAELVGGGAASDQPWWRVVVLGQFLLLGAQVHRYRRRSSTEEREAVRWVILGVLLTLACFVAIAVTSGTIGEGSDWAVALADLAVLPLALGAAAGVLRPRGLDVDAALHATITGWLTVPVLALGYGLVGGWPGAFAVGVAAWPVALAARRAADWVVFRGRPDTAEATARMLARLGEHAPGDSVSAIVLDAAVDAVFLDGGRISGASFEPVERGRVGVPTAFPISYRGVELARLELAPRRGESAFTARDRRVIAALVAHAAPALDGMRALIDLRESRTRVVAAREDERRRLRRDLHDDLGPALAGLSLSAAALARRTGMPEAAELHQDIQETMRQSREIAYGLRPPVLDDHGLVAAIVDRTGADDGLAVTVTAPGPLELPAAVDLAALRIITEAVTNARKHADASAVTVELTVVDHRLEIAIADNGRGLPEDVCPGIGMHSIAERAAEVGGTARYDRDAPGCTLLVSLPLDDPA